jgi:hypothetical protein
MAELKSDKMANDKVSFLAVGRVNNSLLMSLCTR